MAKNGLFRQNRGGIMKETSIDSIKEQIEKALDDGYLVEIIKLRDGTVKAKTVKKKEIQIPTAK